VVAAADPTADLGVLGQVAEGMGLELEDLGAAERAGLVTVSAAGVRFASPLLRSAVYADAGFIGRRTAHARLAEAFSGRHPDRWAWHRAAVADTADPVLADELERSAQRAERRAGYAATASALERAAELTVGETLRRRRLVAAAGAAWTAGQAQRAERLLTVAEAASPGPDAGITLLRGKMEAQLGRPGSAVTTLRSAAQDLADEHPDLAVEALTMALEAGAIAGDLTQAPALAAVASSLAGGRPFPLSDLIAGIAHLVDGEPTRAVARLTSFIDHVDRLEDPVRLGWGAVAAFYLGDEEATHRLNDHAIARARDTGAVSLLPFLLEQRAMAEWRAGQVEFAESDAAESCRLTEELGRVRPALLAMATLTDAAAKRGRAEEARALGARTVSAAEQYGVGLAVDLVDAALMELDLAQGQLDAALERATRLDGGGRQGIHPMVTLLTTPTRVEVLKRTHRAVPAKEVERFREWTRATSGSGYPPLLSRCEALVAPQKDVVKLYEQALQQHESCDRPFDLARTRLLLGELLRRRRRPGDARDHLRAAMQGFDRLGCGVWADRARAELRAAGESVGEPRGEALARLSPQEMQIVRMVAEGMSNREVAGQLFLSPRTVEYHLYKAYPKLGVSSRSELVRVTTGVHQ
jgi:ATP/maltotriose-dependent transcriptional regulator MalT